MNEIYMNLKYIYFIYIKFIFHFKSSIHISIQFTFHMSIMRPNFIYYTRKCRLFLYSIQVMHTFERKYCVCSVCLCVHRIEFSLCAPCLQWCLIDDCKTVFYIKSVLKHTFWKNKLENQNVTNILNTLRVSNDNRIFLCLCVWGYWSGSLMQN